MDKNKNQGSKGSNWSVKAPNELSFVVEGKQQLESPCDSARSGGAESKEPSQKSHVNVAAVSKRLSKLKKNSPKRKYKNQRQPPRSGFFQFS